MVAVALVKGDKKMPEMNNPQNGSITIPARGSISISIPIAGRMPAIALLMFGLITLYCVGFSTASAAHSV